jgi:cell pole-organizing protein PopZ
MTASAQRAAEPSMEEILASIRRIIADDQSRARLNAAKLVSLPSALAPDKPAQPQSRPSTVGTVAELRPAEAAPAPEGEKRPAAPDSAPDEAAVAGPVEEPAPALAEAAEATLEVAVASSAIDAEPISSISAAEDEDIQPSAAPALVAAPVEPPSARVPSAPSPEPVNPRPIAPDSAANLEVEVARLVQKSFVADSLASAAAEEELSADPDRSAAMAPDEAFASQPTLYEAPPEDAHIFGVVAAAPIPMDDAEQRAPERLEPWPPAPVSQTRAQQPAAEPPARPRGDIRAGEPRKVGAPRGRDAGAILSSETDLAVARAFNSLSRTVLSDNARTLEDLVTEMLRPLLKAWLDDNLPALVERLVRMEIERVARGRPD